MPAIGVKSLLGCQGSFEKSGSVAFELVVASSVVPSGSDRISSLTASAPPVPGFDSISTGWPICSLSLWPTTRATTSTPPPGANGTRRRIGRLGSLAWARAATSPNAPAAMSTPISGFTARISFLPMLLYLTRLGSARHKRSLVLPLLIGMSLLCRAPRCPFRGCNDQEEARRPSQPPLARRQRHAFVRPSLAAAPDRLRRRRLDRQAGDRHHQHLERDQSLPFASPLPRRERQARRAAGGRLPDRIAGDVAVGNHGEADHYALSQFSGDGDRGALALASARRRGADGWLRQDHARPH